MKPNFKFPHPNADSIQGVFGFTDEESEKYHEESTHELLKYFTGDVKISMVIKKLINSSDSWEEAIYKVFQASANYGANKMINGLGGRDEIKDAYHVVEGVAIKIGNENGREEA